VCPNEGGAEVIKAYKDVFGFYPKDGSMCAAAGAAIYGCHWTC